MPEQDPTRFESLKQSIKEKVAIGMIGALGLTGGASAEQIAPEPARATEAVPTLQSCANQLAKPPVGTKAEDIGLNGRAHVIDIQAKYRGASEGCESVLQANNANFVGKAKIDIIGCRIRTIEGCLPPAHKTTAKKQIVSGLGPEEVDTKIFSYEGYPGILFCLPGRRKTSRTATFINQVKRNNKVIAESRKKVKVIDPGAYC